MTIIDIVLLILIGVGTVRGFMRGFIRQLSSLLGLIVGLLAAKALYTSLASKLCPALTESMTVAQIIAFVLIWLAVPLLFAIVASVLTKAVELIALGWLNRLLGAALGTLKYLLLVSLVLCVIEFVDSDNKLISATKKNQSSLYYPVRKVAGTIFPVVSDLTQHYILENNDATRRTQ
ncbi:MAG: CvpA family protein [Mediterranea sp.]|jgi:membrane protein required for colicin V production|nr:CvpA family protein [Mediterranea sp.]